MEIVVTYDNPRNVDEWNALCKECGNYLQTTMRSELSKFYGQRQVYFEVVDNVRIVGGVKLEIWQSKKIGFLIPKISKSLSQFGEYILRCDCEKTDVVVRLLNQRIAEYVNEERIVTFSVKGFYSSEYISTNHSLLYEDSGRKVFSQVDFDVAYIDLTKSIADIYAGMHMKHRNMISKAKRQGLDFEKIDCDPQIMNMMLSETYSVQNKKSPNRQYIEKEIDVGRKSGISRMYVCRMGDVILSCALVNVYGKTADYSFGGNRKNDCGAGQYLQYNICNDLKRSGVEWYSLGQVAKTIDENNLKFSEGITRFKMRFGCKRYPSKKVLYVFSPVKYWVWRTLCKIFIGDCRN